MTLPGLVVVFIIILVVFYMGGVLYGGLSSLSPPSTGDLCRHHHPAHRYWASGLWTPRAWTCDAHHTLTETGTSFA
jgi:hypothetical protein